MIKKRRGEKCFAPTFPIRMLFLPIIWHHANSGQNWGICENQEKANSELLILGQDELTRS